ncbi:MAG: Fe-S cluster assembly protein SufB [Waddliaceae bacterium]|jgi:Fe-S cluster assembly protein SufB|nr:Fe-S cluster assembly protein SufB [Waddliaceae bacterium]MBT3579346.1 Fe-S cluster assembly protein SufB [Waddliaceae bacterium]MBT4444836.1 Fe-S cluster assembly protein SufB [Waddliaceae bacterium]MBT6928028.1 Fe-S cluster assembly protein SufB [Waddliaceae bacterium]MBT7264296.1 Fe-S cluster assembly protein SufB [Waddliaceae bacterium]
MVDSPEDSKKYKYGFVTDVEKDAIAKGLDEDVIRLISEKKGEPSFLRDFRLKAFDIWKKMEEPHWLNGTYPNIDYQEICYYSSPKKKPKLNSLDEVDPEVLRTFERLGIPVKEQKRLTNVAVDMVFDSVSIGVTFQEELSKAGVVLCSISEAVQRYPDLIESYLGSVVSPGDNFFAALNSAVFSDGSFVYIPKGVTCPMELSTYFRINDETAGQFERTLIIAEERSSVSYLEGCTAPMYDTNQLHAAIVELVALDDATIKYSTVQNWYPGDPITGKGGVYNFVTKRGLCKGKNSRISWSQVEVGAAITWKYPGCILEGKGSVGEFYSVALTNGMMQADTGTKMIHLGENTRSTIVSKGISADKSHNSYRGVVKIGKNAKNARNYTQCDSMLIKNECSANTFPVIEVRNTSSEVEHEASTSKMNEDQLFYLQTRGISREEAITMIVGGFCKDVIKELPLEFATETRQLLTLKLENSVG